jgi:hypothetical protein
MIKSFGNPAAVGFEWRNGDAWNVEIVDYH